MSNILVVDDQFGVRSLLQSIFNDDGHEVKMAASGEQAIQLLNSFEPDLIVLDMKMPVMNGVETLVKIRALNSDVAVIMLSGYGDKQAIEQVNDLGISYYMAKPFDLFELRKRVKETLNGSGLSTKGSLRA